MPVDNDSCVQKSITPFLKWAGGKRWFISKHSDLFPEKFSRYIEPFVGSGAVFFHLQPEKAILSDLNSELIEAYESIKEDWVSVWRELKNFHKKHSHEHYYKVRMQNFKSPAKRAARFIYLNRTCWNGLYRVNLKGEFNVPIGTKTEVVRPDDDFCQIANLLKNTKFYAKDFEFVINKARKDDFLFIDPPYTVTHNLNGFIKYNNQIFSWHDQIRLQDCVSRAIERGVKVLVTNADHESVRKLYKKTGKFISLNRTSVISGKAEGRGRYSELLVKCY